ncbi:MAG TPA: NEW3 domain-containing protein [Trebonia sp.]|jgi:alpha-galactosidase|nr:NEW3 domain-containing protein [Trebonia sp.]
MFPALLAAVLCAAALTAAASGAAAATTTPGSTAAPGSTATAGSTATPRTAATQLTTAAATSQGAGQDTAQAASQSYNGLALTPPMGWNDWYQYGCGITQSEVLANAQALVSSGLAKDGYDYVNLDDCWMATTRTADGQLQADPTTFPNGIPWLVQTLHHMGLKLGLYESFGTTTCQGRPGSYGHYQQDADTLASWGVSFLKFDYCGLPAGTTTSSLEADYEEMSQALVATGTPIVFSQELPIAAGDASTANANYLPFISLSATISNTWRATPDLWPNFDGAVFGHLTEDLSVSSYAHPGAWNDLDMLVPGTTEFHWTAAEAQTQMSVWAEMASPLLVSSDLADMSAATKRMLGNKAVIAIDQDPLGKQGQLVAQDGPVYIVAKPLANGDVAVLLANSSPVAQDVSTTAQAAGLPAASAYSVRNLWTNATQESASAITASVPGSSAVLYRVSPLRDGAGSYGAATHVSVTTPAAQAGQTVTVPATFTDNGQRAVTRASLSLQVPGGWKVRGTPVRAGAVSGRGGQLSGSWQVTVPPGTQASDYTVTAVAHYASGARAGSASGQGNLEVGNALAGYTADEYDVSQSYPTYGSEVTPLYRDVRSDGKQTLLPGNAITVGSEPTQVAVDPNGKYAYVTDSGSANVDVISTATNTVTATIPVGSDPDGIAITPDGQYAYISDSGSSSVDVIDTATNNVMATVPVGSKPGGIAITPNGETAYVSDQGSATVTPIDIATNTAGTAIAVGTDPQQIAITPNGDTAYVANMGSANVTPIDTATNTAGTAISVSCVGPDADTIDPANSTLYVTCYGATGITPATYGSIIPVNINTNQPGTSITVTAHPQGIVADSAGSTLYATDAFQSSITPIQAATNTPGTSVHVPGSYGIALVPAGS